MSDPDFVGEDGSMIFTYPDGSVEYTADGHIIINTDSNTTDVYPDGTVVRGEPLGEAEYDGEDYDIPRA